MVFEPVLDAIGEFATDALAYDGQLVNDEQTTMRTEACEAVQAP